jgi:hypothetical protein
MPRGANLGERRGGRQKGTPNKRTLAVADKLEKLGCDPIKGMATIAMDENQPMQLRASMYRELAQYIAPKRKAVEVTGDEGGPVKTELTFREWLDSINGKTLGPPSERTGKFRDVEEESNPTTARHRFAEQAVITTSRST